MLYSGALYSIRDGNPQTMYFDQQFLPMDKSPEKITLEQKKPEEMSIPELKQRIQLLRPFGIAKDTYEVELHQRLALPMATFIFALLGSPLGVSRTRSSSSYGFAVSIFVIFAYYISMTFGLTLGQGGKIPAMLAAWLPNIIGLIGGGYLLYQSK